MISDNAKWEMEVLVFQCQWMELEVYNLRGLKNYYRNCETIPLLFPKLHPGFGTYQF